MAIAREVAQTVRNNTSIDWTQRQQAKANLRRLVRRVLRRHGYPPDQQENATLLILEQAEALPPKPLPHDTTAESVRADLARPP